MISSLNLLKDQKISVDRIQAFLLVLLAMALPYYRRISSILLVLLVVVWFLNGGYSKIADALKNPIVLLFISFFVLPLLTLLYSTNKDFSLFEKRASLFVLPIVIYTSLLSMRTIYSMLFGFVLSCTAASVYSIVYATSNDMVFDTEMTINAIGMTHVYFGFYLSFATCLLAYMLMVRKMKLYQITLIALLIAFLLLFMFLLGGKMSVLSLFLVAFILGIAFLIRTKRWKSGLVVILLPPVLFAILLFTNPNVKYRFTYIFNKEHYFVGDNAWSSIGVRFTIFQCARQIFNDPLIGTGVGDVQKDLDACYVESGYNTVIGMNAHNEYVQWTLGTGIVGLLIFIVALTVPAVQAFRRQNDLYLCFILLFALCCTTESLLERQQGVIFFALFNSLLFFNGLRVKESVKGIAH
jgi:O-antigen ligase